MVLSSGYPNGVTPATNGSQLHTVSNPLLALLRLFRREGVQMENCDAPGRARRGLGKAWDEELGGSAAGRRTR